MGSVGDQGLGVSLLARKSTVRTKSGVYVLGKERIRVSVASSENDLVNL